MNVHDVLLHLCAIFICITIRWHKKKLLCCRPVQVYEITVSLQTRAYLVLAPLEMHTGRNEKGLLREGQETNTFKSFTIWPRVAYSTGKLGSSTAYDASQAGKRPVS